MALWRLFSPARTRHRPPPTRLPRNATSGALLKGGSGPALTEPGRKPGRRTRRFPMNQQAHSRRRQLPDRLFRPLRPLHPLRRDPQFPRPCGLHLQPHKDPQLPRLRFHLRRRSSLFPFPPCRQNCTNPRRRNCPPRRSHSKLHSGSPNHKPGNRQSSPLPRRRKKTPNSKPHKRRPPLKTAPRKP